MKPKNTNGSTVGRKVPTVKVVKGKPRTSPVQGTVTIQEGTSFTSADVALMLGVDGSTVRKRARKMGIPKFGADFMFSAADVKAIQEGIKNPEKRGPKAKNLATDL